MPLPRRLRLGGRRVTAFFAAPQLWGPVPLVVIAFADGEHYHLTLFPGRGFTADRGELEAKVSAALNPDTPESAIPPAA
jgi:hypothetical protein